MLPHTLTIGFLTFNTYSFLLGIGICMMVSITAIQYRLVHATSLARVVDVGIGGLIGGLLIGRVVHVLLHWAYFSEHPQEMIHINAGGLNWHGGLYGAILGILMTNKLFNRALNTHHILESLAWGVPLLGFMGWWACGAFTCGYGAEIGNLTDYPAWLVWEASAMNGMIAPRFATQPLGMLWAGVILAIVVLCFWRGWFIGRRLGMSLILWGLVMVSLGYLRGDSVPMLWQMRVDQWLDALVIIWGIGYMLWHKPSRA